MSVSRRAFLATAASGGAALVIGFHLYGRLDAEPSLPAPVHGNPFDTWLRLIIWMAIGLLIYFFYGRSHSKVQARLQLMGDD